MPWFSYSLISQMKMTCQELGQFLKALTGWPTLESQGLHFLRKLTRQKAPCPHDINTRTVRDASETAMASDAVPERISLFSQEQSFLVAYKLSQGVGISQFISQSLAIYTLEAGSGEDFNYWSKERGHALNWADNKDILQKAKCY